MRIKAALSGSTRCMIALCLNFFLASGAKAGDVQALDSSTELLASCDALSKMPAVMEGILIVSWSDGSKICELVKTSLGKPVTIGVFRSLLRASALLHIKGAGETDKVAYQIAELIEARGLTDPKRMGETIDIAFKAYNGSNGRVTPKDLNVAVRQSSRGQTISDDDLFTVAAIISVRKRNNGE